MYPSRLPDALNTLNTTILESDDAPTQVVKGMVGVAREFLWEHGWRLNCERGRDLFLSAALALFDYPLFRVHPKKMIAYVSVMMLEDEQHITCAQTQAFWDNETCSWCHGKHPDFACRVGHSASRQRCGNCHTYGHLKVTCPFCSREWEDCPELQGCHAGKGESHYHCKHTAWDKWKTTPARQEKDNHHRWYDKPLKLSLIHI